MPKSRTRKTGKNRSVRRKTTGRRRWIVAAIIVAIAIAIYWLMAPPSATDTQISNREASPSKTGTSADFQVLTGRWRRPDGGYIIDIRDVSADGRMNAAYFNPNPIHVSLARADQIDQGIRVFIKLDDKGYPGATYELIYYPQENALAGLYHQPAVQSSFQVVFMRTQ